MNEFVEAGEQPIEILEISGGVETDAGRAGSRGPRAAGRGGRPGGARPPRRAAATDENLVEPLVDCARALCTEGEIVEALRSVFGSYTETPRF